MTRDASFVLRDRFLLGLLTVLVVAALMLPRPERLDVDAAAGRAESQPVFMVSGPEVSLKHRAGAFTGTHAIQVPMAGGTNGDRVNHRIIVRSVRYFGDHESNFAEQFRGQKPIPFAAWGPGPNGWQVSQGVTVAARLTGALPGKATVRRPTMTFELTLAEAAKVAGPTYATFEIELQRVDGSSLGSSVPGARQSITVNLSGLPNT